MKVDADQKMATNVLQDKLVDTVTDFISPKATRANRTLTQITLNTQASQTI